MLHSGYNSEGKLKKMLFYNQSSWVNQCNKWSMNCIRDNSDWKNETKFSKSIVNLLNHKKMIDVSNQIQNVIYNYL